jgi:protein-S-isoprenylcysteine O-methyltransferase Ste14
MENNNNKSRIMVYIVPMILMIMLWMVLFLPAGTIQFWEAWIFWLGFSLVTLLITVYFKKRNPGLLSRRTKVREHPAAKKAPALFKAYYIGFIIPGLDFRFRWSNEPIWLVIVSNIVDLTAYIFIFVVFKENSYASTIIQVENEQHVITTGPYSVVRHPMYLGMVVMSLFMPLALGSYFAIIPMLLIIPTLLFRIKNEEVVLLSELRGYKDYCSKTKYRLIPFIW